MEERFWLIDAAMRSDDGDVKDWHAVVDDNQGGIIAYFGDAEEAEKYRAWRASQA